MRYVVVTTDGDLLDKTSDGDALDIIRREVGPPGFDIAATTPAFGVFVNDCGHLDGLPRNVLGTCLAATLTMREGTVPLAGPVVVTGWADTHGMDTETRSLTGRKVQALQEFHRELRILLGYDIGDLESPDGPWRDAMRRVAHAAENAPAPTVRVVTGDAEIRRLLFGDPGAP